MKINEELKSKWPWKVKWDKRAKLVAEFIPSFSDVIDIGGGIGGLYKYLVWPERYVSFDIEEWNDHTIKTDLNSSIWPKVKRSDFVVCIGILEYMNDPELFITMAKHYSNQLILTYRLRSTGGMERKNNLSFEELENLLVGDNWKIKEQKDLSYIERIYYCKK
jgi:hypothetical protein